MKNNVKKKLINNFNKLMVGSVIASSALGFALGSSDFNSLSPIKTADSIVKNQVATIYGQVISIENGWSTVKNSQNQIEKFKNSPSLVVYKPLSNPKQAQAIPATDSAAISLNKDAVISLQLIDNQYQITSVTYLPDTSKFPVPK